MRELLEFDVAGASDDEPAKGVTLGDIRAWHNKFEEVFYALSRCYDADIPEVLRDLVGEALDWD